MQRLFLALGLAPLAILASPSLSGPTEPASPPPPASSTVAPFHCQVPCGIYGDRMRVDMHLEDVATIEKAMDSIVQMESQALGGSLNTNQMVRWVMNKESHAQAIQDRIAEYWLAQRIKAPADSRDEEAVATYHAQLELMHRMTVAAMKCKQSTDLAHVAQLRGLMEGFAASYFTEEDEAHLREHAGERGGEHREGQGGR